MVTHMDSTSSMQGGAAVAHVVHTHEVAGSTPAPAPISTAAMPAMRRERGPVASPPAPSVDRAAVFSSPRAGHTLMDTLTVEPGPARDALRPEEHNRFPGGRW